MIRTAAPAYRLIVAGGRGVRAGCLGRAADETVDRRTNPDRERAILASDLGVAEAGIARVEQVHGDRLVRVAGPDDPACVSAGPEADALWTTRTDVLLSIRTADCLPVYMWSTKGPPLVALVHAGWRGLHSGIVRKAAEHLLRETRGLAAHVGVGISAAHYRVGSDTARHFTHVSERADGLFVDLAAEAADQLLAAGAECTLSAGCTYADNDRFYSHRRGDAGRNLSYIGLLPTESDGAEALGNRQARS